MKSLEEVIMESIVGSTVVNYRGEKRLSKAHPLAKITPDIMAAMYLLSTLILPMETILSK